jgi:aspartate kinase
MTGAQCGIITDGKHSEARIRDIATYKIYDQVDERKIVIVAGFQGVTPSQEITTLGRGGSDTTATALAAALRSPQCEIYTDVDGVYTADPRVVPDAKLLQFIGYAEMLEYAVSGSGVLHPRCVEIAKKYDVPLRVLSSFSDSQGTLIVKGDKLERIAVTGVTGASKIARATLVRVQDQPGVAAKVFETLANSGINILLIIQSLQHQQTNDISIIIREEDGPRVVQVLEGVAGEVGADKVELATDVAKISIVGSGIASTPGVAARLFRVLAEHNINIEFISTSEVRIACIIARNELDRALKAVHAEFQLESLERKMK